MEDNIMTFLYTMLGIIGFLVSVAGVALIFCSILEFLLKNFWED